MSWSRPRRAIGQSNPDTPYLVGDIIAPKRGDSPPLLKVLSVDNSTYRVKRLSPSEAQHSSDDMVWLKRDCHALTVLVQRRGAE